MKKRSKLYWWLMDRSYDRPWTWLVRLLYCRPCSPERDHCGRLEHDFCIRCGRPMPGQARRRGVSIQETDA